jgi:hypothetical protein
MQRRTRADETLHALIARLRALESSRTRPVKVSLSECVYHGNDVDAILRDYEAGRLTQRSAGVPLPLADATATAEPDVAKRSAKPSSPVPSQNEGEGAK